METCFGGFILVLKGYLFRKKSGTSDRSYWLCCGKKCPAKGILHANGKFQLTKALHNHNPVHEDIKKKERLMQLKKLALQLNVPGHELLETLGIKDDVKKHLNFIRTCRSRLRKQNQKTTPKTASSQEVGTNYKSLFAQNSSSKTITHLGYFYRQDSVNPYNEGCKYWRCKISKCKARAKTDRAGNLTILNGNHSHPPEESDTMDDSKQMVKSEIWKFPKVPKTTFRENTAKNDSGINFGQKIYKNLDNNLDQEESLSDTKGEANSSFCPSVSDADAFCIEKLVEETLEANYGVTTRFHCP